MKKLSFKFDQVLALTVLCLLIFGLIMITSIGVPKSIALSAPDVLYPNCSDEAVDCYLLFKKHLARLGIGFIAFLIAYKIPTRFWKKISPVLFVAMFLVLLAVVLVGSSYGTIATNWLVVAETSLQPSEFAKLVMVLYLGHWLSQKGETIKDLNKGLIAFCIIVGMIVVPIVIQNDYGATFVIGMIALMMYVVAGARTRHVLGSLFVAFLVILVVIATVPHVKERFDGFKKIDEECLEDYCWQSQQANVAIGSGGFWGKGLTQGVQKSYWLPQASDDFIFAASAEELGFVRIIFVVLAYGIIAWRGAIIAIGAKDKFEMLVAIGISSWLAFQGFINIAVNTALMPVTGITLPFVSYGGSSLVASLAGVAILLKISANTSSYAYNSNRGRNRRTYLSERSRYRRT